MENWMHDPGAERREKQSEKHGTQKNETELNIHDRLHREAHMRTD